MELVLVCAGADARAARESGMPLVHLCLGLHPNGGLRRLTLPGRSARSYLGVCDQGMERFSPPVCDQLIAEAAQLGAVGLVADCERRTPPVQHFLSALDARCAEQGLPLYVPLAQADCVHSAGLIVDTAVSGGSLSDYFRSLLQTYPGRIAADLRPVSCDFSLPAPDADGTAVSAQARDQLRRSTGAQTFFSRELCARYFTYMDAGGSGHFVLFDDADTLREKYRCLQTLGVGPFFARYPDVKPLLSP